MQTMASLEPDSAAMHSIPGNVANIKHICNDRIVDIKS